LDTRSPDHPSHDCGYTGTGHVRVRFSAGWQNPALHPYPCNPSAKNHGSTHNPRITLLSSLLLLPYLLEFLHLSCTFGHPWFWGDTLLNHWMDFFIPGSCLDTSPVCNIRGYSKGILTTHQHYGTQGAVKVHGRDDAFGNLANIFHACGGGMVTSLHTGHTQYTI
jgi:hypothetical protein